MTDRELLEAAANAAEYDVQGLADRFVVQPEHYTGGLVIGTSTGGSKLWNPLTDDGDALRLAVKLNIPVIPYDDETSTGTTGVVAKNWGGKEANTRRAIVRAAAAMAPAHGMPGRAERFGMEEEVGDVHIDPLRDVIRQMTLPPRKGTPAADLTERERLTVCIAAGAPTESVMDGMRLTVRTTVPCGVADRGDGGYIVTIGKA